MYADIIIPAATAFVATLIAGLLSAWLQVRWSRENSPNAINRAAYELAYRGTLRNLTGRQIKSRKQAEKGTVWLKEARYLHRRSAQAGENDAVNDIREAVVASTIAVDPVMPWDPAFLEQQIRTKLEFRFGNRPVPQFRETWSDAIQSAAFYQQIIQAHMRWQRMISTVAQFVGAIALFAAAVFLISSAPSIWMALDKLPHDVLAPERILQLKILYSVITAGFLGGGIALMAVRR